MSDRDPCPLTWSMCAGIVMTAGVFILTQVQLWSLRDGIKVAFVMGFSTWGMIEAMIVCRIAWELWKAGREERDA